ncbi:MAG TPA: hypothetical protein VKV02_10605 [Acidobacteriaceae bacterium]|nr:hypothetical protein [Acidobacteriaceae bacterium]
MRSTWNGGRGDRGGSGYGGRSSNGYDGHGFGSPGSQGSGGSDERDFFDERTEVKTHSLTCPNCQQTADYALSWLVRRKRARLTGYADAAREARFAKARSYMVRRDDLVACQNIRCRKRFEIAGLQSVAFLEDAAGGSVEDRAARIRAAFAGRGRE